MIIMVVASVGVTSVSAKIGDVIGYTTYTDIKAYINHYAIQSFNVDGYTVVVAEDLKKFGFSVEYNDADRSLRIERDPNVRTITRSDNEIPTETSPKLLGKPAFEILETDIKTYVNGEEVKSYNIGGKTAINMNDLSAFGGVVFDQTYRVIKLWITDGLAMLNSEESFKPLPKTTMYDINRNTIQVYEYQVEDYLKVGWYETYIDAYNAKAALENQKKTLYSADGRTIKVFDYEVQAYLNVGWYKTKQEADNVKNAAENAKKAEQSRAIISKFYVGQTVSKWSTLCTKYGRVESIDKANGKILVYWNDARDGNGQKLNEMTARFFGGLYQEEWVYASEVTRR